MTSFLKFAWRLDAQNIADYQQELAARKRAELAKLTIEERSHRYWAEVEDCKAPPLDAE